jgi:Tol biopolymer transport system component
MTVLSCLALVAALPSHGAEISVAAKGHASNPVWSTDGSMLAFELNDYSGNIALFVSKMNNGNPVGTPSKGDLPGASSQFGGSGTIAANPSWHPEGPLMFEGSSAGGTMRIYFWQPGAGMPAELLNSGQISGDLTWPAVSPDGSKLVFVSDATGKGDLYLWDRASNSVSQSMSSPFTEAAPSFDRSGGAIAFSRKNQGGEDLFVFSDGSSAPLIGGNGDQTRPIYTGGSVAYFTSERGDGKFDIAVSSGPGKKKVIAKDVRLPVRASPALSPDGLWVAYGSANPENGSYIFITKADGSQTVKINTELVAAGEPSITVANGRTFLAFTALPGEGADWRRLHVVDITGKL